MYDVCLVTDPCLLKMAIGNAKASVMDDDEVEVVTGAVDCELAEVDATDEDVMKISQQGTSHGQMTRKRNTKAAVWTYFSLETDESGAVKDQDTPVCTVGTCGARVKTKHSSTSNLYSHLIQHHPQEYEAVRPRESKGKGKAESQRTIQESF